MSRFAAIVALTLACITAVSGHPNVCGVSERWGCGGGECKVPGWRRGCKPRCGGRNVSCGKPLGRRNWWRAKRCHCATGSAKCRVRCRRLKRRKCDWKRRARYRYQPQWRKYRSDLRKSLRRRGFTASEDDHHVNGANDHRGSKTRNNQSWRWYKRPHWQRYYVWVPICKKRKFTKCFCPPNPCRCDRNKKPTPKTTPTTPPGLSDPTPSTSPDGDITKREPPSVPTPSTTPAPTISASPSPSTSPIFTTVAASPIQPAPDSGFDPNAPLNLP